MYAYILLLILPGLMLGAAVGLFFRGKVSLSLILGSVVILYTTGMQYIVHSSEAPGFTEPLSITYLLVKYTTDICIVVQNIIILIVCWGRNPQSSSTRKASA